MASNVRVNSLITESISDKTAEQVPLQIRSKINYSATDFILHGGVTTITKDILSKAEMFLSGDQKIYPLISVLGDKRSGKSHYSIYLEDKFSNLDFSSVFYSEGKSFASFLEKGVFRVDEGGNQGSIIVVDDADEYLDSLSVGDSGPLVDLLEHLKVAGGFLLLIRSKPLHSYRFDEHLTSRFQSGIEYCIEHPQRSEILSLTKFLMKQRGVHLTDRKLAFLSKRLPATVAEIESYVERSFRMHEITGAKMSFPVLARAL